MTVYTAMQARANLYQLMKETAASHKPIYITSKNANAVLISEEDWFAIQETLHLCAIPRMGQSIKKGLKIPLKNCDKEFDW